MAEVLDIPVISSGSVKTLDDISILQLLPGIAGAIVGRALMANRFTLPEALAISRQAKTKAEFI
jgi:phosphoribosylformimino-5-aminoimidazole carboxamide ribonucleotide (ProFAR) isomerase